MRKGGYCAGRLDFCRSTFLPNNRRADRSPICTSWAFKFHSNQMKKLTKQRIQGPRDRRLRKRSDVPAAERERGPYLERDLDGYVHTPAGFLTKSRYLRILRENPDSGLPEYEALPLMKPIDY